MGIFAGAVGYFLVARRLGIAAALLSVAALILGIVASQGGLPFMGPTDEIT
jgi:hypothetical protein